MYLGPPHNRSSRSPYGHGHVLFLVLKHVVGVFMLTNIAIGYVPHTPHHVDAHDSHNLIHVEYSWHDTVWRSESDQSEHHDHDPHTEEEEINVSLAFSSMFVLTAGANVPSTIVLNAQLTTSSRAL